MFLICKSSSDLTMGKFMSNLCPDDVDLDEVYQIYCTNKLFIVMPSQPNHRGNVPKGFRTFQKSL